MNRVQQQISHSMEKKWINEVRHTLMQIEKTNIQKRASECKRLITNATQLILEDKELNISWRPEHLENLWIDLDQNQYCAYLSFIQDWNGIPHSRCKTAPRTKIEYEKKSRNWLNGRRAPEYAKTLFPDIIEQLDQFSQKLASFIVLDIHKNTIRWKSLQKIFIYKFLVTVFDEKITINDPTKKTTLLCKNSLEKRKGPKTLQKSLRKFCQGVDYPDKFPTHARQAVDYFQIKYNEARKEFLNSSDDSSCGSRRSSASNTDTGIRVTGYNQSPTITTNQANKPIPRLQPSYQQYSAQSGQSTCSSNGTISSAGYNSNNSNHTTNNNHNINNNNRFNHTFGMTRMTHPQTGRPCYLMDENRYMDIMQIIHKVKQYEERIRRMELEFSRIPQLIQQKVNSCLEEQRNIINSNNNLINDDRIIYDAYDTQMDQNTQIPDINTHNNTHMPSIFNNTRLPDINNLNQQFQQYQSIPSFTNNINDINIGYGVNNVSIYANDNMGDAVMR